MKAITSFGLVLFVIITFNSVHAQYCTSSPVNNLNSECDVVQLAGQTITLNKNTTSICASYSDFTAGENVPDLQINSTYTINITQGTCGSNSNRTANAWIDFNHDNDFLDANEMLGAGTVISNISGYVHSYTFTVPAGAMVGNTRMRVMVVKGAASTTFSCKNNYSSGETEDYTVEIIAIPLPISLSYFDAKPINNTVELNWQTTSEVNNEFFTIESSKNRINWTDINQVEGAGNSNIIINYKSVDETPLAGVSYYRIKQIDFDGQFSYSNIVAVDLEPTGAISIFPNPANEVITLTKVDMSTDNIRIYNSLGQDVTWLVKLDIQSERSIRIDLSRLRKGLYLIKTKNTADKVFKQ